jgi:hypothetical protein
MFFFASGEKKNTPIEMDVYQNPNLASPNHQITFSRIEQTIEALAAAADHIPGIGYTPYVGRLPLPGPAPIVAVDSEICCPARLPAGD